MLQRLTFKIRKIYICIQLYNVVLTFFRYECIPLTDLFTSSSMAQHRHNLFMSLLVVEYNVWEPDVSGGNVKDVYPTVLLDGTGTNRSGTVIDNTCYP